MIKNNPVQIKSYQLAKEIIKVYRILKDENEFEIGRQIIRSGTSVGANIEEAIGGQSKKDFLMNISIAYKEARETHFWLRLLKDCYDLDAGLLESTINLSLEVLKMLGSIQKSTKSNLNMT